MFDISVRMTIFTALILVFIVSLQLVQRWSEGPADPDSMCKRGALHHHLQLCAELSGVYYAWPISSESFFFFTNKG